MLYYSYFCYIIAPSTTESYAVATFRGSADAEMPDGCESYIGRLPFQVGIQERTIRKAFLVQSRDVDTGSCHLASDALRRYKSGTGLSSGITSAAPGIILVVASLSLIHCQTFGSNDDEHED